MQRENVVTVSRDSTQFVLSPTKVNNNGVILSNVGIRSNNLFYYIKCRFDIINRIDLSFESERFEVYKLIH